LAPNFKKRLNLYGTIDIVSNPLDYVKEFENFIAPDDIKRLVDYINANKDDRTKFRKALRKDRWDSEVPEMFQISQHLEIKDILKKLYEKFVSTSKDFYKIEEDIYPYAIWMAVLGPTCSLVPHQDNHKDAEYINLSGVIYLNDNYRGGELHFTVLNHTHIPKAGSLIIFPSNYVHEIKEVVSGYRYALPVWATKNKEKSVLRFE